ncbi:hypothetical protein P8452_19425 [Trifolium repens]|nr:hypothetical protein P8452_19425 [Trifolium repens]
MAATVGARKIFALHSCKNCEQVHPLVSLLLSDEFDFGFGSIASIWSYEVLFLLFPVVMGIDLNKLNNGKIHSDINLSFLITMNMVKQLSDLTDEKLGCHQLDTSDTTNWYC